MNLAPMMSVHTDPIAAYWEQQAYGEEANLPDFSQMNLSQDTKDTNAFQIVMPRPCRVTNIGLTWMATDLLGVPGQLFAGVAKNGVGTNANIQVFVNNLGAIEYFWTTFGGAPIFQTVEFDAGDRLSMVIFSLTGSGNDLFGVEARMNVGFTLR